MTERDSDHVVFLRRQASAYRKAAEEEVEEKKRLTKEKMADKFRNAAGALEIALTGNDPGAMGGHIGLQKAIAPGTLVTVRLMTGETLLGKMGAMGRYDFALTTTEDKYLIVAKHAVAYWDVMKIAKEQEAPAP